jgi:hypothetical protein
MTKHDCPRQGDLLFVPRENTDNNRWLQKSELRKNGIVQEGEATGHHHRLEDPSSALVYRPDWGQPTVVVGERGATFVHQEHGPTKLLPKVTYDVHRAREHDITGEVRYVVD